jgi:predicted TPR repeat methyltransferase
MDKAQEGSALDQVYAARSPQELALAYQTWTDTYDRDTLALGYCLPFVITAWLARYVRTQDSEILDAGCGTGLSASLLNALGYNRICGLDFSDKMLAAAAARGGYRQLVKAELGHVLPFEDGRFAAFISTGVFTAGHAPASSLFELVRILKPGGFAVFTVRDSIFDQGSFRVVFSELENRGSWRLIERSQPFRAFAIAEPDILVSSFVFQKM